MEEDRRSQVYDDGRRLGSGDEHSVQYTDDAPAIYTMSLTTVAPIKVIKFKK